MHFRLLLFLLLAASAAQAKRPAIRPPYLQKGDTVGIAAPAGKLRPDADTAAVRERFASWGLHVKFAPHFFAQDTPYFAGADSVRAADLQALIDDPGVRAIVSYKGGYGSVRLLERLQLEHLRRHPKWIAGFSDITMLHLALGRLGVESIHGPMPSTFHFEPDSTDTSAESLRAALFGLTDSIATGPHTLDMPGEACGVVAGGNLTLICSAIGTPEQLDAHQPTILLIEEVGEAVYRLDRMMMQLERSGLLDKVRGVVVGHFTAMQEAERFGDPAEVVAGYFRNRGIPVAFGFPAGHEAPNTALYMGRRACLEVSAAGATLRFR